jgi:hypothetical protein
MQIQVQMLKNTLYSDFCIVKVLTLYIYRVADRGASRRRESIYGAAVCGSDRGR